MSKYETDLSRLLIEMMESGEISEMTEEEAEAMQRRRFPPIPPFSFQHWTFDVLYDGEWYRIDASLPESEFYEGVPKVVQRRAHAAIKAVIDAAFDAENGVGDAPTTILRHVDHTEEYEAILRGVFDGVRFVETDFYPGRVFD